MLRAALAVPFARLTLLEFIQTAAKDTIPAAAFSESATTGVLLELTYRTVLDQLVAPSCPSDPDGSVEGFGRQTGICSVAEIGLGAQRQSEEGQEGLESPQ